VQHVLTMGSLDPSPATRSRSRAAPSRAGYTEAVQWFAAAHLLIREGGHTC